LGCVIIIIISIWSSDETFTGSRFVAGDCIDLKKFYYATGVKNRATVFLFMDTQIVEESFVEDINNILSSGEVSNLYKPDEFEEVCCSVNQPVIKLINLYL